MPTKCEAEAANDVVTINGRRSLGHQKYSKLVCLRNLDVILQETQTRSNMVSATVVQYIF